MSEKRIAIVTGGARGIGKSICETLADNNYDIAIMDVLEEEGKKTVVELNEKGIKSEFYMTDISNYDSVIESVEKVKNDFGKIDILINNAGITKDTLLLRMSVDDWDKVININLKGTFNCIKACSRILMKNKWGRIVNLSSVIGLMGNAGQANYAASKAGIIGLTKSVAKELAARNVTCNAIAPGFISTPMTDVLPETEKTKLLDLIPLKRFGQPEDVANLVKFLVSEETSYITGQVIQIDGGMVM